MHRLWRLFFVWMRKVVASAKLEMVQSLRARLEQPPLDVLRPLRRYSRALVAGIVLDEALLVQRLEHLRAEDTCVRIFGPPHETANVHPSRAVVQQEQRLVLTLLVEPQDHVQGRADRDRRQR